MFYMAHNNLKWRLTSMQIKFTCWHFLIMMIYSYGLPTWAASDALFSNASNKLTIPYASFWGIPTKLPYYLKHPIPSP